MTKKAEVSIDMPINCWECKFYMADICCFIGKISEDDAKFSRRPSCPLKPAGRLAHENAGLRRANHGLRSRLGNELRERNRITLMLAESRALADDMLAGGEKLKAENDRNDTIAKVAIEKFHECRAENEAEKKRLEAKNGELAAELKYTEKLAYKRLLEIEWLAKELEERCYGYRDACYFLEKAGRAAETQSACGDGT